MPIIQTLTFWQFRRAFDDAGRENQFSYEGLELLYEHLENLSEDLGEPIELDVIALCCEYTEFDGIDDLRYQLGYSVEEYPEWEDIRDGLERHTTLLVDDYDNPRVIVVQNY